MRPLGTLIWKETRETLIYLWIGLFLFLVLPLIGMFEARLQFHKRYEISTSPWVLTLGGVLAVFVAVGASCRDLRPRLMDFWQSRPVRPWQWMLVKFFVGLAIVWLGCLIPLIYETASSKDKPAGALLWIVTLLCAAVYGLAFLAGCLVRRTAHAAMLALAAMLLLWLLPTIVPALNWLDLPTLLARNHPGPLLTHFAVAAGLIALLTLALSLLLIERGWQLQSGPRLMYGAIGGAVLLLVASLTLRLGTNLPELASVTLGAHERFQSFERTDNNEWTLATYSQWKADDDPARFARTISLTPLGMTVGPRQPYAAWPLPHYWYDQSQSPAANPKVRYNVETPAWGETWQQQSKTNSKLMLGQLGQNGAQTVAELWPASREDWTPTVCVDANVLAVFDSRYYAIFDVSDPLHPRETRRSSWTYSRRGNLLNGDADTESVLLPPLPDMSPRARLAAVLGRGHDVASDGDLAVIQPRTKDWVGPLMAYELSHLTETTANFRRISQQPSSSLDSIFGRRTYSGAALKNGLLYQSNYEYGNQFLATNPSFDVLDVRNNFKMIGHFAAPGSGWVIPLEDGRAVTIGSKIYLVGPPPKR